LCRVSYSCNAVHIACRICGGPVRVQCTCDSHLWWTRLFRVQCTCNIDLSSLELSHWISAWACFFFLLRYAQLFTLFWTKSHVLLRCSLISHPPPIWYWTCSLLLTLLSSFESVI
jgi:hypothetical protein